MNVKEINYGTGNRVGDTIYINKDLKKYPGLYEAVLAHEMKHTGGFKLKDIKLDLINEDIKDAGNNWSRFIWSHPRAWVNFLPVMKLGDTWAFDLSISLVWIFMILLFGFVWLII